MLSKKWYERIAAHVAAVRDPSDRSDLAHSLMLDFAKDNPRFERSKFLDACNVKHM